MVNWSYIAIFPGSSFRVKSVTGNANVCLFCSGDMRHIFHIVTLFYCIFCIVEDFFFNPIVDIYQYPSRYVSAVRVWELGNCNP